MKRYISTAVILFLYAGLIYAQGDPFGAAEDKGSEIVDAFQGGLGVIIIALSIIVAAIGALANLMPRGVAIRIFIGGMVIGSAVQIAQWIVG